MTDRRPARTFRPGARFAAALVLLLTVSPLPGSAKSAGDPPARGASTQTDKTSGAPPSSIAPASETPEAGRQARLAADTAALYKLAQELKEEVDKSSKDTMSLAVIKKAAEVEKMARELKEKMKSEAPPKL